MTNEIYSSAELSVPHTDGPQFWQYAPTLSVVGNGLGWVVVWSKLGTDGSQSSLFQKHFDLNADAVSSDQPVYQETGTYATAGKAGIETSGTWLDVWTTWDESSHEFTVMFGLGSDGANGQTGQTFVASYTMPVADASITRVGNGDFVVTWSAFGQEGVFNAQNYGIFQRHYDASGNPLGDIEQVNVATTGHQEDAVVLPTDNGGWMVVWEWGDIYCRRYDANGNALTGEVLVNTTTTGSQYEAAVTTLQDHGWIIAWSSTNDAIGNGSEIYFQRYDKYGNAVGGEIQATNGPQDYRHDVEAATLSDGSIVLVWTADLQDGSESGIYQQRFDVAGNPLGAEMRVNTFTTGHQMAPDIVALVNGDWVVAWETPDESGQNTIHQRVFSLHEPQDIYGTAGDDFLKGSAFDCNIYGLGGNDEIHAGPGKQTLYGGDGNDIYYVNANTVIVEDGNPTGGNDIVHISDASFTLPENVDALYLDGSGDINGTGNGSNNIISGNSGDNILYGGDGNDILAGNGGDDMMIGGDGNDEYHVIQAGDSVVESSADGGDDIVLAAVSFTLPDNVEDLAIFSDKDATGTGNTGNNVITGTDYNDTLKGLAGNDVLYGNDGNDTLFAGTGVNSLFGGKGADTYFIYSGDKVVETAADGGWDTVFAADTDYTLPENIEELWLTGVANAHSATGNALANIIVGGAGDNVLRGEGGNDNLDGDGGHDVLIGGAGDDTYNLAAGGDDAIVEEKNGGNDIVLGSGRIALAANVERLQLDGAGNGSGNELDNTMFGSTVADTLSGLSGWDILLGNGGADLLDGGAGADQLRGGKGNDIYVVDNSGDRVIEWASEGYDTVRASISLTLGANLERLDLLGSRDLNGTGNGLDNRISGNGGRNALSGGSGDDYLSGGANTDRLFGGNGADVLNGGSGADQLTGGAGGDRFVFTQGSGKDRITDFHGNDIIDLSAISAISGFRDLIRHHVRTAGNDLVIFAGKDTITLAGIHARDLHADDFAF